MASGAVDASSPMTPSSPPNRATPPTAASLAPPPPPTRAIMSAFNDDLQSVDHFQSQRLPPFVAKEIKDHAYKEASRRCYEVEKVMTRCLQDKMWTAWKCQKERDVFFRCVEGIQHDPMVHEQLRWKYALGTFHGETVARRRVMEATWKQHFPDRDLNHSWATD